MSDKVQETIATRGEVYGDPYDSHVNIGLEWTGILQQHYGKQFSHPIPAYVVALMMAVFKCSRAARAESPFHADNYTDMEAYGPRFAAEFEKRWKDAIKPPDTLSVKEVLEMLRRNEASRAAAAPLAPSMWRYFKDGYPALGQKIEVIQADYNILGERAAVAGYIGHVLATAGSDGDGDIRLSMEDQNTTTLHVMPHDSWRPVR